MDLDDTAEDAEFRRAASAWLEEHADIRTGLDIRRATPSRPDYVRRSASEAHALRGLGRRHVARQSRAQRQAPRTRPSSIRTAKYDVSVGVLRRIGVAGPSSHGPRSRAAETCSQAPAEGKGGVVPAVLGRMPGRGPSGASSMPPATGSLRCEQPEDLDGGFPAP